jgi:glycosyltransferase involved in cell wall biosynthesis
MGSVVALPRKIYYQLEAVPANLDYRSGAAGSKWSYLLACLNLSVSERAFDFILCTHLHLLPLAWILALRYRCPVVPVVYGRDAWTPTRHRLTNYLCRRLRTFISIRYLTAKRLIAWSGMKPPNYYYLPNCIDPDQYGVAPARADLVSRYGLAGKTVIMTSGRLDGGDDLGKGFDEMLEVLPELRRQVPGLVYVVMGDGEDRPRLAAKAKSLGVDDITVFTGYVSEADKADHYRLAQVFAMPGSNPVFDRYPYRFVFLEALACGVPVVGARVEDAWEIADRDTDMIIQVDPSDKQDIVRGVMRALSMPRGVVSPILRKYYYEAFRASLHGILEKVVAT